MDTVETLAKAFQTFDANLFVVDRSAREATGFWHLGSPIPTDEIIDLLRDCSHLHDGDSLLIPIHELDSAELTGQYIRCQAAHGTWHLTYYDFSKQQPITVNSNEFSHTTPALQIRFWHPDYQPPATPSYLKDLANAPDPPAPRIERADTPELGETIFEEAKLSIEQARSAHRDERRRKYDTQSPPGFFEQHSGLTRLQPAGRYAGHDGSQVCKLRVDETQSSDATESANPSQIHPWMEPGVEVIVDTHGTTDGFPVEAEIIEVTSDSEVHLRVKWSTSSNHSSAESAFAEASGTEFRLAKLLDPQPFVHQRTAVEAIENSSKKRGIVTGRRTPTIDDSEELPAVSHLDQYQTTAVTKALAASDLLCIHGPPGTGKTRLLMLLARNAARRGMKVLACAPTDAGIDTLLVGNSSPDRVDPKSPHADAVAGQYRVSRVGSTAHPVTADVYAEVETWEANVVGSPLGAAHQFREDEFDMVLVDDAHRCTVPDTMIPYTTGQRLILAGDDRLLPPRSAHETDSSEAIEISLFEHLAGLHRNSAVTTLRNHYHMNEAIAEFPNTQFYGGILQPGQRNRRWRIRDDDPLVGMTITGPEDRTPTGSYYNVPEAEAVAGEIRRLVTVGVPPARIGVVTPYSGQVGMITKVIDDPSLRDRLTIGTIEAIQSDTKDVIIVSFVRSNDEADTGFLTFPTEGPRRLNTILTRAKKRLVLIGDWDTLRQPASRESDSSSVYDALYRHLERNELLTAPSVT